MNTAFNPEIQTLTNYLVGKRIKDERGTIGRIEGVTPNGLACVVSWLNVFNVPVDESAETTQSLSIIDRFDSPYLSLDDLEAARVLDELTRVHESQYITKTAPTKMTNEGFKRFQPLYDKGLLYVHSDGILQADPSYLVHGKPLFYTLFDYNKFRLNL